MRTHRTVIATYMMGSGRNGTIYTGRTSNLFSRVWKHRTHTFAGFTEDYDGKRLVWFEPHAWVVDAIRREKRIKTWLRDWTLALIATSNPEWRDLAADGHPVDDPDWTPPPEEESECWQLAANQTIFNG
jgi:putative endonuclease